MQAVRFHCSSADRTKGGFIDHVHSHRDDDLNAEESLKEMTMQLEDGPCMTRGLTQDESLNPTASERAHRVLARFLRDCMSTWRFRMEIKTLHSMNHAFEGACCNPDHVHFRRTRRRSAFSALPEDEKRKRVLELQQRASIKEPPPMLDHEVNDDDDDDDDPENDGSSCEDPVTVETVVHNLFLQVEDVKRQSEAKDHRIRELEALVASLASENRHLLQQLLEVKHPLQNGSHCAELRTECVADEPSNQCMTG